MRLRAVLIGFVLWFASGSVALATCTGQFLAGQVCGTTTAAGYPSPQSNPVLGVPGTSTGTLALSGSTSGKATITPQTTAGTPTLTLPNTTGTLADGASTPLVLDATTGNLTCPTCLTGGGGTLTASAPLNITTNNISLQGGNGTVAAGSGGTGSAFTATPTLGVAGTTLGTLSFANLTSGSETIEPATGALGSGISTLPAGSYNIVGDTLSQALTNKTYNGLTVTSTTGTLTIAAGKTLAANNSLTLAGTDGKTLTLTNGLTVSGNDGTLSFGAASKTLAVNNSLTFAGTDATTMTFPATSTTVAGLGITQTFSGNNTFSGQIIGTGTTAPASASGNTVLLGTLASAPTLTNTGQAFVFNQTANGAVVEGDGSSNDFVLLNKSGATVLNVPTGTTVPQLPGLAAGTCVHGLALDSSNNVVQDTCPGTATSIAVGTTTIGSGTTGYLLYNNGGTLGNETVASVLTVGSGISLTGTTNVTIAQSLTNTTLQASPVNPTGTTSTTGVMMGLGSTCKLTPAYSGRLKIEFLGQGTSTGTTATTTAKVYYGTGTAPANAAATTGTQIGNSSVMDEQGIASLHQGFANGAIITGLTPGTAYWFDLNVATSNASFTAAVVNLSCNAMEF